MYYLKIILSSYKVVNLLIIYILEIHVLYIIIVDDIINYNIYEIFILILNIKYNMKNIISVYLKYDFLKLNIF